MKQRVKLRVKQLRFLMEQHQLAACLIWQPENQYYFTNFRAIGYSRPIITMVHPTTTAIVAPSLEELHLAQEAVVDHVYLYEEIPTTSGRLQFEGELARCLSSLPKSSTIGVELKVIPADLVRWIEELGFKVIDLTSFLIDMRQIKDDDEIERLKVAGQLSDVAVQGSLKNVQIGMSELAFDQAGDAILLSYAAVMYPDQWIDYENWTCSGIERSAMPHLFSSTRRFRRGDMVIHSRQVSYQGYRAENERTFFIGQPAPSHRRFLEIAIEAQQVAVEMIRPGILAKEVDLASYRVFKKYGVEQYVNHRVGHGIGLSEHEEPYLRYDNELILQEGMVYTIEPGIYIPGMGGYRHSDTVILTKNGRLLITSTPREVEEMILDV